MPRKRGRGDVVSSVGDNLRACWKWFCKWVLDNEANHKPVPDFGLTKNYPGYVQAGKSSSRRLFKQRILAWAEDLFGAERPWKLVRNDFGYGLVLTGRWDSALRLLQGQKVVLSDSQAERMRRANFKSLISCRVNGEVKTAQLIGTICLVNHSCVSPIVFYHYKRLGCSRVRCREREDIYPAIRPGNEITICYSRKEELGFECRCASCLSPTAVHVAASDSDYGSDEEYYFHSSECGSGSEREETLVEADPSISPSK